MNPSPPKHVLREDIQGLRALAVMAVIANHAAPILLPGGFCGVDVFFVISGYLIGKHLLESIQGKCLSFTEFYARRARRLFPALLVTLAAVWGFGWMILSGPEFQSLGQHIAAATLFANNFLLQSESGYFDTAAASKPLLHLWSLGVEEQFYLLVPLLLWLGSRRGNASISWVARLAVLSLLMTECATYPSFYLLDTRFWELGTGVALGYLSLHRTSLVCGRSVLHRSAYIEVSAWVCAVVFASVLPLEARWRGNGDFPALSGVGLTIALFAAIGFLYLLGIYRQPSRWVRLASRWRHHEARIRPALAAAGALLLTVSFVALRPGNWPGPQTLLPVLGTALIIWAPPTTPVNAALGSRPLKFVGDLSYPLYLWHWPLLVYARMLGPDLGALGTLIPIGLAFLLSWLTNRLVEDPARFGRLRGKTISPRSGWIAASGLIAAGVVGLVTLSNAGFPRRFPQNLQAVASWSLPYADTAWRLGRCYLYPGPGGAFAAECTPVKRGGTSQVLLWGDSHAAQLYPGLSSLRSRGEFDLIQWTASGCPPTRAQWPAEEQGCEHRREWILDRMRSTRPDTVLMAARWELYEQRGISQVEILRALADDVRWLRELGVRRIVLFGPGPSWNASLPMDLFRYMSLRRTAQVPERLGSISDAELQLDHAMEAQARSQGVQYVSELDWFCNSQGCRTTGHETQKTPDLLFRDQDHLTPSGSRDLIDGVATTLHLAD